MKTNEQEETISVWVDRLGTPGHTRIIVSLDDRDGSTTLRTFRTRSMRAAKAFAQHEAKRMGLSVVVESPEGSGQWVPM